MHFRDAGSRSLPHRTGEAWADGRLRSERSSSRSRPRSSQSRLSACRRLARDADTCQGPNDAIYGGSKVSYDAGWEAKFVSAQRLRPQRPLRVRVGSIFGGPAAFKFLTPLTLTTGSKSTYREWWRLQVGHKWMLSLSRVKLVTNARQTR
jgi:hypothetical protein